MDGLPLFRGAQLAIDTNLVSVLHCDGSARPRTANVDGVVLAIARQRKERTYPELVGPRARGTARGSGWRGCRQLVRRNQVTCQPAREGSREERSGHPLKEGGTSMADAMDVHPWVQRSQGFCQFPAQPQAGGADGETPFSHDAMGDFRMSEIDMV